MFQKLLAVKHYSFRDSKSWPRLWPSGGLHLVTDKTKKKNKPLAEQDPRTSTAARLISSTCNQRTLCLTLQLVITVINKEIHKKYIPAFIYLSAALSQSGFHFNQLVFTLSMKTKIYLYVPAKFIWKFKSHPPYSKVLALVINIINRVVITFWVTCSLPHWHTHSKLVTM